MTLSVKVSGAWKTVSNVYVKVSGAWKECDVHTKVSGSWKEVHTQVSIPEGVIVAFLGAGTPTGWTDYTAANGKFIVAAGSGYSVGATGGSNSITLSGTTNTTGAHTGSASLQIPNNGGFSSYTSGSASAGSHAHSASKGVTANLKYREYKLIRAGASVSKLPGDGVVFSTAALSAISNIHATVDAFLKAAASDGATGGSMSVSTGSFATSTSGAHQHGGIRYNYTSGSPFSYDRHTQAGSHSHTVSGSATLAPKQVYLAAWSDAAEFAPESGAIVMYDGVTAPDGWYLCDGNNGTVDLRDYFLRIGTTGNMGSKSGNNTAATGSITTGSGGAHTHDGGNIQISTVAGAIVKHADSANAHTHSVTLSGNFTPPYYALTFIQKT